MFSYLHRYHAGSTTDIHKHLILIALLSYLHNKASPICILDAYAGEGIYDLHCTESEKNAEYKNGIGLLRDIHNPPDLIKKLLNIVKNTNPSQDTFFYPGSPAIAQHYLRPQDQAIFIEQHPKALGELKKHFSKNQQIHIHGRDALEGLKALVPFKEKRGLIFIDPSYEVKTEYESVADILSLAYDRFPHGIYALWYPILAPKYHESMLRKIKSQLLARNEEADKIWHCEWRPFIDLATSKDEKGLKGSGMLIINLPWQVDKIIINTFNWLKHIYPQGRLSVN